MLNLWRGLRLFLTMTLVTGLAYPLIITAIAQLTMRFSAEGSLIYSQGQLVGSSLIAQKFESEKYFWPRPSAVDYNPLPSGASNLGPTSRKLKQMILKREKNIFKASKASKGIIPREMLYASGSGLDPHISPEAAFFQLQRVIKARGFDSKIDQVENLINQMVENTAFPFLGPPYINVLKLNLALDELEVKK